MLRYITLLVFAPFFLQAQNTLMHTHMAVQFTNDSDPALRLSVLQKHGLANEADASTFLYRPYVMVPKDAVNVEALKQEPSVVLISEVQTNAKHEFVTYRENFFVLMRHANDLALVQREAAKLGVEVVGPNQYTETIIELKTDKNGMHPLEAVAALKATGLFRTVSPNLIHTVSDCSVDDPRYDRQWNLKNEGTPAQGNGTVGADIAAEEAWAITTGSPNVKIAIVDSGIDTLHPDLAGKLLPGFDAFGTGTNGYPTPNYPSDGHGTACAGIATAITNNTLGVAGVCPECKVIPVRVFYYQVILGEVQPWSETQVFIDGIAWQWQVGNADVSSNSWGVPDYILAFYPGSDTLVNAVIDVALEEGRGGAGLPMLFSSGNDGITDTIPIWPARYAPTIAVGATSMCDEHKSTSSCDGENWAGNWGEGLDVSAPGVRIPTTDMLGTNGFHNTEYYNSFNGTSAACPNAAGIAALIVSEHPLMQMWQVRNSLRRGAEKVGGYDYSLWKEDGPWSYELGYGRVNAYNSLVHAATLGLDEVQTSTTKLMTFDDRHELVLSDAKPFAWTLTDMSGRMVANGSANGRMVLNHVGLSHGLYALHLEGEGVRETLKVVVD